jgi:hypothetical protein
MKLLVLGIFIAAVATVVVMLVLCIRERGKP